MGARRLSPLAEGAGQERTGEFLLAAHAVWVAGRFCVDEESTGFKIVL